MKYEIIDPFENDTSLDPRPLPSLHMRIRCSALSSEQVPAELPRQQYVTSLPSCSLHLSSGVYF